MRETFIAITSSCGTSCRISRDQLGGSELVDQMFGSALEEMFSPGVDVARLASINKPKSMPSSVYSIIKYMQAWE